MVPTCSVESHYSARRVQRSARSWRASVHAACPAFSSPRVRALPLSSFPRSTTPRLNRTATGLIFGIGEACCFFCAATLPSMYFRSRRNVATGIVYSGAGVGGAVLSITTSALLQRTSLEWTFRSLALIMLALNLPASLALRTRLERQPLRGGGNRFDWCVYLYLGLWIAGRERLRLGRARGADEAVARAGPSSRTRSSSSSSSAPRSPCCLYSSRLFSSRCTRRAPASPRRPRAGSSPGSTSRAPPAGSLLGSARTGSSAA